MSLSEDFRLRQVRDCSPEQVEAVRRLRNLPAIRSAMYGDQVISEAEHAAWGFDMGPDAPRGLGGVVLAILLDHAFGDLGLEKINGEVIEGNAASLALHRKLGFKDEGLRRSQVRRLERRLDVHLLGLTVEDWLEARETIRAGLASHSVVIEAGA